MLIRLMNVIIHFCKINQINVLSIQLLNNAGGNKRYEDLMMPGKIDTMASGGGGSLDHIG